MMVHDMPTWEGSFRNQCRLGCRPCTNILRTGACRRGSQCGFCHNHERDFSLTRPPKSVRQRQLMQHQSHASHVGREVQLPVIMLDALSGCEQGREWKQGVITTVYDSTHAGQTQLCQVSFADGNAVPFPLTVALSYLKQDEPARFPSSSSMSINPTGSVQTSFQTGLSIPSIPQELLLLGAIGGVAIGVGVLFISRNPRLALITAAACGVNHYLDSQSSQQPTQVALEPARRRAMATNQPGSTRRHQDLSGRPRAQPGSPRLSDRCAICQEDLDASQERSSLLLPCGHLCMHWACYVDYRQHNSPGPMRCPLCRLLVQEIIDTSA